MNTENEKKTMRTTRIIKYLKSRREGKQKSVIYAYKRKSLCLHDTFPGEVHRNMTKVFCAQVSL